MSWHYFKNGETTPRGFVRVTQALRTDRKMGYVPEIIGEFVADDTRYENPHHLKRTIVDSVQKAEEEIFAWAKGNEYLLRQPEPFYLPKEISLRAETPTERAA